MTEENFLVFFGDNPKRACNTGRIYVNISNVKVSSKTFQKLESVLEYVGGIDYVILERKPRYYHMNPTDSQIIEGFRKRLIRERMPQEEI